MTRVLIAMDGTPESIHAAQVAVGLFGPDSEYLVVNVAPPAVAWPEGVSYGGVFPMSGDEWDRVAEAVNTGAHERAENAATAAGIEPAEVIVEHGDPVAAICSAADEHDADVIVVGPQRKGWLARVVEPSLSHALVKRATRPVLLVGSEHEPED
ncbi:MAG: universal stress protein [Acidimicrobiia bacterium]